MMTTLLLALTLLAQEKPYVIRVLDESTGRGVPLVELKTSSNACWYSDSAGVVAFDEPGLLGRRVFFFVKSPGYECAADGFGIRGIAFDTAAGGSGTLKLKRTSIAERLYRITGQGIYDQSLRAGLPTPLKHPALNAGVTGQDTGMVMVHRGKIRWFWGDTSLAHYAMGHFGTATATSELPGKGGLDPSVGIDLDYAVDAQGNSRPTFAPGKPGPIWVHGAFVLKNPEGEDKIVTQYERVDPSMKRLELGLAVFDDEKQTFNSILQIPLSDDRHPFGQALRVEEFLYFALPYPVLRVKADWSSVLDPAQYEAYTCLRGDEVQREGGKAAYAWRKGEQPLNVERQEQLIRKGVLNAAEAWIRTSDAATGKAITLHRGSVRWNEYRKRWIMVATRKGGEEGFLGEIYYLEAERPEGPWLRGVKVAGHPKMTVYNPVQHAFFDQEGGRKIYFECTYTISFSESTIPTPRYEYNQLMYRLDLEDPRLNPLR